jgi:hypothetical protein
MDGRFTGERVLIVASGPSARKQDVERFEAAGFRTIAVSDSYRLCSAPDIIYSCDGHWWAEHIEAVEQTASKEKCWTQDYLAAKNHSINWIKAVSEPGLSLIPERIHSGENSGYQAINVAAVNGATFIGLLGFDMKRAAGKAHWFGDHPTDKGFVNPGDARMKSWCKNFDTIMPSAMIKNIAIVNFTRSTALTCFPIVSIEEFLCQPHTSP